MAKGHHWLTPKARISWPHPMGDSHEIQPGVVTVPFKSPIARST